MKLNCVYSIIKCFVCMGSIAIKHMGATSHCHFERSEAESRNLRSNSFLSIWHAVTHTEQETIRKQFPIELKHTSPMPDRKLFASSFLLR